jgi:hypothetical protein
LVRSGSGAATLPLPTDRHGSAQWRHVPAACSRALDPRLPQRLSHTSYQLLEVHGIRLGPRRYHDVEPSAWSYRSNGLTHAPATPITSHRSTFTDLSDEPDPRPPAIIRRASYDNAVPPGAPTVVQDLAILPTVRESCKDGHHWARAALGRQPASALGPPGFQDRPAGAGAHTGSEAMLALTTAGIGLKRALRHQLHLRSICPTGPRKIVVAKFWGLLRVPAQYRRRAFLHVKRAMAKESPRPQTTLDARVLTGPNMSRLRSRMRTGSVHFPPEEPVEDGCAPGERRDVHICG